MQKIIAHTFLLLIIVVFITSCKGIEFENQKIALAEEFSKGETMVFVAEEKNKYETRFGKDLWNLKSGDGTLYFKDYIVNNVKKLVEKIMMLKLAGRDLNVVISINDAEKLDNATEEYRNLLTDADISYMGATVQDIRKAFEDYHIARLVIDNLSKNASSELSISEAKVIAVQYIVFDNIESARETEEKLKAKGASFAYFARTRSVDTDIAMTIRRGDEMSTRFPELFYLSSGQTSGILQYANRYYIFKCTDDYMEDETEQRRLEILKAMKNTEYNNNVNKYEELYNLRSNSNYWKEIDLADGKDCKVYNFEEIYYKYFPKSIR